MNEIPKVEARAVRSDSGWDLYVVCPFCGKEHHHGGGRSEMPDYGSRVSHCTGAPAALHEYELIPGTLNVSLGRRFISVDNQFVGEIEDFVLKLKAGSVANIDRLREVPLIQLVKVVTNEKDNQA